MVISVGCWTDAMTPVFCRSSWTEILLEICFNTFFNLILEHNILIVDLFKCDYDPNFYVSNFRFEK